MKKKILFLIHDLQCGGAERVLVNLVNSLDQEKYDITVQTLFDVGMLRDGLNDNIHYIGGFKKMFRGNVTLTKLFTPKQLCKMLIKDDYDLVVSYLEGQCSRILSAYERKKIAWIHTTFNTKEEAIAPFKSFDEAINCYSVFNKIACVSKMVEEKFNEHFELSNKTCVIHNLLDVDDIIEKSTVSQSLISKSDNFYNIVSVGKLDNSIKGFDRIVRIHKHLLDDGINNKLYIIGDGKDKTKLEVLIEKLNVSESVILTGFVENPYKYVKKADLFVCSSHKEGYSTAVTEALVLGVPVISTDVSGARELIGNSYGVVSQNSEDDLYASIKKFFSDLDLFDQIKSNCANFDVDIYLKKCLDDCSNLFDEMM